MPRRRPTAAQEIEHLESHVKEAFDALKSGRNDALRAVKRLHPRFKRATLDAIRRTKFSLADARLIVALEHGFPSWKTIRGEAAKGARAAWNLPIHERTDDPEFGRAIRYVNTGNLSSLANLLRREPSLVRKRVRLERSGPFCNPSPLEIAAATRRRRDKVPPNLLRIVTLLLNAGAGKQQKTVQNALNLAAANPWPNESTQRVLIRLLLRRGAKPEPAMARAAFQGATAALEELVRHGGKMDFIAVATMGRTAQLRRRLPHASTLERRKALVLACVQGQTGTVRILLEAGLDPNRFNPRGFYEHSMPIHQAVWFGHLDTVKLLVERGADLTIRDKAHHGTPLGWAVYGKKPKIVRYLKANGAK